MNIMRFREKVKLLPSRKILTQKCVDHVLQCPVFLCGDLEPMTDLELEWCKQNILEEGGKVPRHLPFPVFSAIYTIKGHKEEGITDSATIVWGEPFTIREGHDYLNPKLSLHSLQIKCSLTVLMRVDGHESVAEFGYTGTKMTMNTWMDGIETTSKVMENKDRSNAAIEIGHGARNVMLRIVFDIMNPSNVVLRVSPKPHGRSVTWVQAHTHYCIINKTHAARCLRDRRGPTDTEIERSAHWRRAHMRRLVSDKFTHKKGQLVFVKQSWVGPEEWEGTDSKVYKVINTTTNTNKP